MQIGASSLPYAPSNAYAGPKVGTVLSFDTALTGDDKAIVKAATGYDADNPAKSGTSHVPQLAATIAISRAQGILKGPVTESFLQQYGNDSALGPDTILKALNFVRRTIHPSSELLNKAVDTLI